MVVTVKTGSNVGAGTNAYVDFWFCRTGLRVFVVLTVESKSEWELVPSSLSKPTDQYQNF
jgi:hypothetical protein